MPEVIKHHRPASWSDAECVEFLNKLISDWGFEVSIADYQDRAVNLDGSEPKREADGLMHGEPMEEGTCPSGGCNFCAQMDAEKAAEDELFDSILDALDCSSYQIVFKDASSLEIEGVTDTWEEDGFYCFESQAGDDESEFLYSYYVHRIPQENVQYLVEVGVDLNVDEPEEGEL